VIRFDPRHLKHLVISSIDILDLLFVNKVSRRETTSSCKRNPEIQYINLLYQLHPN